MRIWGEFGTAPLSEIRNNSVGDWQVAADGTVTILAAETPNRDYAFLLILHELVEWYLCQREGITDVVVTAFDAAFEAEIAAGAQPAEAEPGEDIRAPYHFEHRVATELERLLAKLMPVDWQTYEAALDALVETEMPASKPVPPHEEPTGA